MKNKLKILSILKKEYPRARVARRSAQIVVPQDGIGDPGVRCRKRPGPAAIVVLPLRGGGQPDAAALSVVVGGDRLLHDGVALDAFGVVRRSFRGAQIAARHTAIVVVDGLGEEDDDVFAEGVHPFEEYWR